MLRTLDIRINPQREFQVVQLASWAAYGDAWLCAHDVFHHDPSDAGSMQDEAMSFGAELWIGFPGTGLEAISAVSFGGAALAAYEHRPELQRLLLPCEPPPAEPLESYLFDRLREVVDGGFAILAEGIVRHRAQAAEPAWAGSKMAALTSSRNRERYAKWMVVGYRRAEARFPSPRRAQRLVESFQRFLERAAALDGRSMVTVEIDEAEARFEESASRPRGPVNPE